MPASTAYRRTPPPIGHDRETPLPASRVRKRKTPGARKIRAKYVPVFTRQMAAMLSSGMPIVQTLEALEQQNDHKVFKNIIAGVRAQIEGGASLSDALSKYPDVFEELYVSMVEAGETGGLLADTAGRLAQHLEAQAKLRRKVVSAMMYPAIVTFVAFILTTAMIIWIVPAFASIYDDFDAALPGPTQFLVNVSNFTRKYALFVFGTLTALIFAIGRFRKTEQGAYLWDNLMLRLPIFGELMAKVALSRFASTFSQLTRSGVPILHALEITSVATGNKVIGRTIANATDVVERGEPLSSALVGNRNYPAMLVQMLAAGEKTGKVDEMLRARKRAVLGHHEETLAVGNVAGRALDLGVANIRRRPQRGALTAATIVLVTFTLLSFTSLVPEIGISRLRHPLGVPTYRGLLARDRSWAPLPLPLYESLLRRFGRRQGEKSSDRGAVAGRAGGTAQDVEQRHGRVSSLSLVSARSGRSLDLGSEYNTSGAACQTRG